MNEIIDLILKLSQDVQTMKAYLYQTHISRKDKFSDEWIDGQDVMQMLYISKRTLQSLRDNGKLPFTRINNKFYYKLSDLESLMEDNYSIKKSDNHGNK